MAITSVSGGSAAGQSTASGVPKQPVRVDPRALAAKPPGESAEKGEAERSPSGDDKGGSERKVDVSA